MMASPLTIEAPASAWKDTISALALSSEKSQDSGDGASFLSCALFTAGENSLYIESESRVSTTFISIGSNDDEFSFTGVGVHMVPLGALSSFISHIPAMATVEITFDEENSFTVATTEGEDISFTSSQVPIADDDATPHAESGWGEASLVISAPSSVVSTAYSFGSVMAMPTDKDPLSGQDPLSGAVVEISRDGHMEIFSLSNSSSESLVQGHVEGDGDSTVRCLTEPSITLPRLKALSHDTDMKVGIDTDGMLYVRSGRIHMTIYPLNIGARVDKMSMDTITRVASPVWESRVVSVRTPSRDFFSAMSRASIMKSKSLSMSVGDSAITLSIDGETGNNAFSQVLPCTTQWMDDGEHWIESVIYIDSVKKISSLVGSDGSLIFDISCQNDGSPWAMVVRDSDYDPDDPHNFFLIPFSRRR